MYTLCLSVPEWTSRSGRCCFMKQQRRKWGYVMPFYLFLWTADLVAHIAASAPSPQLGSHQFPSFLMSHWNPMFRHYLRFQNFLMFRKY